MTTQLMAGAPTGEPRVAFEWRLDPEVDEAAAQRLADTLRTGGGEAVLRPRPKGVLIVAVPLVIFGVVAGVALVEQVVDWWTDRKKSGVLIHVGKDGKVDIRPIDIPAGHVLFVGADGKTVQYVNTSADQMKQLLAAASAGITPPGGADVPTKAGGG